MTVCTSGYKKRRLSLTTPALLPATQLETVPAEMFTTAPSETYMKPPFPEEVQPVNSPPVMLTSEKPSASEVRVVMIIALPEGHDKIVKKRALA